MPIYLDPKNDLTFKKVFGECDRLWNILMSIDVNNLTKGQLLTYDRFRDAIKTQRTYLVDARKEGKIEGVAEGVVIGRAEGEAIGIEKGRAESNEEFIGIADRLWKTAMVMKSQDMDVDTISKVTGWCKEELASL